MNQLEQIADGLFVNDTTRQISVKPSAILIPDVLEPVGHAYIASRLLNAAVQTSQWVGIPYQGLEHQYLADMTKPTSSLFRRVYQGLRAKLGRKPTKEKPLIEPQVGREPTPFSTEIQGMVNKGYLQLAKHGEQDILIPTPKLVDTIYQAQQAPLRRMITFSPYESSPKP